MAQDQGLVEIKISIPELDGTFSSVSVQVPADADDAEIQRRLELAERVQLAVRERFYWGGGAIEPANHILTFGNKHRGKTLGQILAEDAEYLQWVAYEANAISPVLKLAAQWVCERGAAGQYGDVGANAGASFAPPL